MRLERGERGGGHLNFEVGKEIHVGEHHLWPLLQVCLHVLQKSLGGFRKLQLWVKTKHMAKTMKLAKAQAILS